ncbi:MAG TPA: PIG-L deacetylase family protein [Candidatus Dormibacteraeota bacterium]|jgi:LmbE family N-acetylglucosaminyl deacetylase
MTSERAGQRLLVVMPHPDDECFSTACTIARYASEGTTVSLLTLTRGGAGLWQGRDPGDLRPLTDVRELELREAARALGVAFVEVLDYPDGALEKIEEVEATRERCLGDIVRAIRIYRPQVVVTFGPEGVYGHPDHKAVSRLTVQACSLAGEPSPFELESAALGITPWYPSKLYFQSATPATVTALELPTPAPITTRVRTQGFEEAKIKAFRAHRSQAQEWGPLRKVIEGLNGEEVFSLVGAPEGLSEEDLFQGVDLAG